MKEPNAAEKIRAMLGCYNIMLHKPEASPRKKKIAYGEILRADRAAKMLNKIRASKARRLIGLPALKLAA